VRQRGGTIVAQYVELDAGRAGIDQAGGGPALSTLGHRNT
jgi:hypothetical protein